MPDIALEHQLHTLFTLLFDRGGWTLIALACLSVVAVATTMVSCAHLTWLHPFSSHRGAAAIMRQSVEQSFANGNSRSHVEELLTIQAKGYLKKARAGFRLLDLIITTAPLLGLLGTVLGMIKAFQAMQEAGDAVNPSDLAGGIWEALITTAAGMIVALIALGILALLEAIVDHFQFRLERVATEALLAAEQNKA